MFILDKIFKLIFKSLILFIFFEVHQRLFHAPFVVPQRFDVQFLNFFKIFLHFSQFYFKIIFNFINL